MNQSIHLYAVSARLFEAAGCAGQPIGDGAGDARGRLGSAMKQMREAERLWGRSPPQCGHHTNMSQPHAKCTPS